MLDKLKRESRHPNRVPAPLISSHFTRKQHLTTSCLVPIPYPPPLNQHHAAAKSKEGDDVAHQCHLWTFAGAMMSVSLSFICVILYNYLIGVRTHIIILLSYLHIPNSIQLCIYIMNQNIIIITF